jgi:hypothetical protein
MEPSPTAHRPQGLIVADLGVGRMLSFLTTFATTLGLLATARAGAVRPPRPAPPAKPNRREAWHSYAVYSGALSPRDHKSSRRLS